MNVGGRWDNDSVTLSEFLLARIAEDEAVTWALVPYDCAPGCCAPEGWVGHECTICQTREFGGTVEAITAIAIEHDEKIHGRSRMLAECEAKRRVLALHVESEGTCITCFREWVPGDPGENIRWEAVMESWPCPTLRAIATPYISRPDFQQAWTRATGQRCTSGVHAFVGFGGQCECGELQSGWPTLMPEGDSE